MQIFYTIASIDSGNRYINYFLPVRCNEGSFVTCIHYVQSISHNIIKQGLASVVNVCTSPGCVMRNCITADNQVSSISPATCQQPFHLSGRWGFNIIIRKVGRSENNLTLPPTTRRFNFNRREVPGTVMHQRLYPKAFLTKVQVLGYGMGLL
jgi:hypothetical protein